LLRSNSTLSIASPKEDVGNKQKAFVFSFSGTARTFWPLVASAPPLVRSPFPFPLPSHVVTRWDGENTRGSQSGGPRRSNHDAFCGPCFPGFQLPPPSSRQTRVRFSPPFPTCTPIHPFTVIPFRVTPFSRCGPRCHCIVIYRSEITFLAPAHLPFTDLRSVCFR